MKNSSAIKHAAFSLGIVVLISTGVATTAQAAGPALQGQVKLRPLTPTEMNAFALTNAQGASGLTTIGVGQPAYLEALVNNAVPNSDITNVTWVLTTKPVGSAAVFNASPLGTNIPTFNKTDRISSTGAAQYKVAGAAGRTMLRPDITGQYTVTVTIRTGNSGNTNVTRTITAATYLGINSCSFCHSGGLFAPDKYNPWSQTAHASIFAKSIDGLEADYHTKASILRHTVGYDTNAVNDGFDDVATGLNWIFPTNLTAGNWTATPSALKTLANVQCESCHGPGSEHAFGILGSSPPYTEAKAAISVSYIAGSCAQCHDNMPAQTKNEIKYAEWSGSRHAVATRSPSGAGREACVRCHTASGFANFIRTGIETNANTAYEAITCAACHDPHDATNPQQLRPAPIVTLPEGTTITNAGLGALCMQCHHSRNGSASNNVANYKLGLPTWAGGSSFGVHDSTAGDMIEGVNAFTYGKFIPSGTHNATITNVCVGCHMQPVATTHPAFGQAGGHTYSMSYNVVNVGVTNAVDLVDVCVKCHGPMEEFNFARKDYDGDGVIQGVQTEVKNLLDQLSRLLPNTAYRADGNYVADGLVKSIGRTSTKTNWQDKFLQAAWNWQFVNVEGSHGVHNAPYAVGVLKASIADLTDDADNDGISDKWEILNFGSITSYNGNGDPDGDGVKNSLEISAGTNPLVADSDGDGVNDLAEMKAGSDPLNILDKPGFVVKIYTAAEIEFASEISKRYQVQTVSDITSTWINVGSVTNGTGNNISMVTSTRAGDGRGYFRVVQVP